MNCATCKYRKPHPQATDKGYCRYNPPVVLGLPVATEPQPTMALPSRAAQQPAPDFVVRPSSVLPLVVNGDFCHHYEQATGTIQ